MSDKYIEIECSLCGKIILRELKKYKYACKKKGPNYKPICSQSCGKVKEVQCKTCGKFFERQVSCVRENNFCNHSCAAKYTNKNREIPDVGTKEINCLDCGKLINASKHASLKRCDDCILLFKRKRIEQKKTNEIIKKNCIICDVEMEVNLISQQKYCDICRKERWKEIGKYAGKKSSAVQVRRSKNEIYFAELCEKEYSNVLTNEPFFDSKYGKWDADIILPDYKVAILWNGIWHYKKVREKHSLKQVQSRDKIKDNLIKKNGYEIYIITDMGRYNKDFVEEQFDYLKFYIKNSVSLV